MEKDAKIYVSGHKGLVGSAILRTLQKAGYSNLLYRTRKELDLTSQEPVRKFFEQEQPDYVFLAAAKVGGIMGNNTYPADFIYINLAIQNNIIHSAHLYPVKKLLFLGSSCIYPKQCPQPMKEEYLMTGPLEPTNSPYAVAKIAGIEMCRSYNRQYGTCFIPVMPTNLYGINDNFNLETSHVLPALIRKFHLAKLASAGNWENIQKDEACFGPIPGDIKTALGLENSDTPKVILWGSGSPKREFLHVDDLADACVFIMNTIQNPMPDPYVLINIGTGTDQTIKELADITAAIVGFEGQIVWDTEKPDGTMQKLLDISRLKKLGWKPATGLEQGIKKTYDWYVSQY
ncbi:GDP-4-keto-6-deoxy-D-mannose-3,5-epimerase-4-reductase [Desulfonema limicola]|uniref:GDP-L-fucose synthase n=1 Tax=Desulfonema limicola TaxID=45656 RepID=A0A975GFX3_9BACT|nr:GDP-L-fucose synthase [Desulfonema limicola]QTA79707.1 GDP-4-keto-6-deoxy-D-mannose-3,5-epimerase-4-reductase [Desulfonema limicola]